MSIPTEAIEAAARAWAIHDETDGCFERVDEWEALEDWEREAHLDEYPGSDYEDCGDYRERATAALTAAAPFIQAAAVAEALEKLAVSFEATASWASYIGTEDIMETWLNAAQRARKAIEASK